jgi:hypothetical protein
VSVFSAKMPVVNSLTEIGAGCPNPLYQARPFPQVEELSLSSSFLVAPQRSEGGSSSKKRAHYKIRLTTGCVPPCAPLSNIKSWSFLELDVRNFSGAWILVLGAFFLLVTVPNVFAADTDTNGVHLLHTVDPTLQGQGVRVGQPEGSESPDISVDAFEVNPFVVGQPTNLFTWISSAGYAGVFPNTVGTQSVHGNSVAEAFYGGGAYDSVAPQVAHVNNYDADYFYNHFIAHGLATTNRVVNQSFNFSNPDGSHLSLSDEQSVNSDYDDYALQYGVMFVSGAGNDGTNVYAPATTYNGIGVGVFPGTSSHGPTLDGRCKPDITAAGALVTSFSTPYVSGSAAVLVQAGMRGDGGADTNAASDNRTIKALLLNGAVKPANWTNSVIAPLDARYGAGILNAFNSWHQMKGGEHPRIESTTVTSGNPHPPGANLANEPVLTGWDFNALTNAGGSQDHIAHYYFNLTGSNQFTCTATLVWNRQMGMSAINDLNLFLYNAANSNLVLNSTSAVDNVEHLWIPTLPPGRYDLQVQKNAASQVSSNETYALAFEFFNISATITQANTNAVITWPIAPAGFEVQSATNITSPVTWSPVTSTVTVDTNAGQNIVTVPLTNGIQFFRLQRP